MGAIESTDRAHHFTADLYGRNTRQPVPQLAINLNLSLQMPAGVPPDQLPAALQAAAQSLLQQLQADAQKLILAEVQRQMPVVGFQGNIEGAAWRRQDGWS
jgi:hypothetical protein